MNPINNVNSPSVSPKIEKREASIAQESPPQVVRPSVPLVDPNVVKELKARALTKELAKGFIEKTYWPHVYDDYSLEFFPIAFELINIYDCAQVDITDRRQILVHLFQLLIKLQKDPANPQNSKYFKKWADLLPNNIKTNPKLDAVERILQFRTIKDLKVSELRSEQKQTPTWEKLRHLYETIDTLSDLYSDLCTDATSDEREAGLKSIFAMSIANAFDDHPDHRKRIDFFIKRKEEVLAKTETSLLFSDSMSFKSLAAAQKNLDELKKQIENMKAVVQALQKQMKPVLEDAKKIAMGDIAQIEAEEDVLGLQNHPNPKKATAEDVILLFANILNGMKDNVYKGHYRNHIRFECCKQAAELLNVFIAEFQRQSNPLREVAETAENAKFEAAWNDLFTKQPIVEEPDDIETEIDPDVEVEEEIEVEQGHAQPEPQSKVQDTWLSARAQLNRQLDAGAKYKRAQIAREDALYHYDVFSSSAQLYRVLSKNPKFRPFAQFVLLKSSALAVEQMLTVKAIKAKPIVAYSHFHHQLASAGGMRLTLAHHKVLDSINGCGVYHRYGYHAQNQLTNQNTPLPQTLEWVLQPKQFTPEKVETYISQIMHFLLEQKKDFALEEVVIEQRHGSRGFKETFATLIDLRKAVQVQSRKDPRSLFWQQMGSYLDLLHQGTNSLSFFPQSKLFLAHVDGILTLLQLIDEQLEAEITYRNGEPNRMHDLEEYRRNRHHVESEENQKIIRDLNIQTGLQYPNKWRSHNPHPQAGIDLRFRAVEITKLNDDDALPDFEQVRKVGKRKKTALSSNWSTSTQHSIHTMLDACLQMAQDKIKLLSHN